MCGILVGAEGFGDLASNHDQSLWLQERQRSLSGSPRRQSAPGDRDPTSGGALLRGESNLRRASLPGDLQVPRGGDSHGEHDARHRRRTDGELEVSACNHPNPSRHA